MFLNITSYNTRVNLWMKHKYVSPKVTVTQCTPGKHTQFNTQIHIRTRLQCIHKLFNIHSEQLFWMIFQVHFQCQNFFFYFNLLIQYYYRLYTEKIYPMPSCDLKMLKINSELRKQKHRKRIRICCDDNV